jgi:putative ABC transport system permease protein
MISALLFGIVPALRASRIDVAGALRTAGRSGGLSGTGRWLRNVVVVSEVALAFVLLVGSGLMMRSFMAMYRAHPGFDAENTLTFFLPNQNIGVQGLDAARARIHLIRERLGSIPGVTGMSASSALPMNNDLGLVRWGTDAALRDPTLFQQAELRQVQGDFFDVMGTRMIDGRTFSEADMNPAARVAVIDEVFANKAFPGERAVGKRFLARLGAEPEFYEVIGVVEHQRNESPAADGREAFFLPGFAPNRWVLRAGTGDPMQLVESVRTHLREINADIVMADVRPMTELVDNARAATRFTLLCIAIFAIIAALLASVGLYGVQSTAVRTRTAELGMRMALGASARNNFALIVRHGITLSALGIVAGVVAGLWLTRILSSMLVDVQATDPITFVLMALLFLLIAVVACAIPASRAARLQPLIALREE